MTTIVFAESSGREPVGGAERGGVGQRRVAGEELVGHAERRHRRLEPGATGRIVIVHRRRVRRRARDVVECRDRTPAGPATIGPDDRSIDPVGDGDAAPDRAARHRRLPRALRLASRARARRLPRRRRLARGAAPARCGHLGRPRSTSCTSTRSSARWATRPPYDELRRRFFGPTGDAGPGPERPDPGGRHPRRVPRRAWRAAR